MIYPHEPHEERLCYLQSLLFWYLHKRCFVTAHPRPNAALKGFVACYGKKCWRFGCRQFSYRFSASPGQRFTLKSFIKLRMRKKNKDIAQDKMGLINSNGVLKVTPQIFSELGGKTERFSQKLYFLLFHAYFWSYFKIRLLSSDFYLSKKITLHTYCPTTCWHGQHIAIMDGCCFYLESKNRRKLIKLTRHSMLLMTEMR